MQKLSKRLIVSTKLSKSLFTQEQARKLTEEYGIESNKVHLISTVLQNIVVDDPVAKYISGVESLTDLKDKIVLNQSFHQSLEDLEPKNVCLLANVLALDQKHQDLALTVWEQLIVNDERNAMFSVAKFVSGMGNVKLQVDLLRQASIVGHYEASFHLAQFTVDHGEALALLQDALDHGMSRACNDIAHIYMEQNKQDKAIQYLKQGAKLGDPYSKFTLASSIATEKVDGNMFQAFRLWNDVAQNQQQILASKALCNMANCCFLGVGYKIVEEDQVLQPDYKSALGYWNLATKLDRQNLLGWLHAANVYYDGIASSQGISQNFETAAWNYEQLLDEAGILGVVPSYEEMGAHESQAKDIVNIASLLLQNCYQKLGLLQPPQAASEANPVESMAQNIKDTIQLNKTRDRSVLQMMVNPDNPDYDKQQVVKDVQQQSDRNAEHLAVTRRWKFVEMFIQTATAMSK